MARTPQAKRVIFEMNNFTAKQAQKLIINAHGALTTSTPRDTGWAANNWIPALRSPFRETVGTPKSPSVGAGMASGELASIAGSYEFKKGTVYISNNVPYIGRLNAGHSAQAPAGFVELSIQQAVRESL